MISKKLLTVTLLVALMAPPIASAYDFSSDLKLGDTGADVRALQQTLNLRSETRVAESGPGGPGEETTYFGEKTRAAVVRYQEMNKEKVLSPLGLFAGTGYVGALTRETLEAESGILVGSVVGPNQSPTAVPETQQTLNREAAAALFDQALYQNRVLTPEEVDARNAANRGAFLEAVRATAEANGLSEDQIAVIEESVVEQSEIPTAELIEVFKESREEKFGEETRTPEQIREDVEKFSVSYNPHNSLAESIRNIFGRMLGSLSLRPQEAIAQTGLPVGSAIYYAYLCTCSGTWLIGGGMPRPGLYDYETGVQAFAGYNLPFTPYFLGWALWSGPMCWVPFPPSECIWLPSTYGMIMPITGSSPI